MCRLDKLVPSGSAEVVATMDTDTGRNYLSTYFDAQWRREHGFEV